MAADDDVDMEDAEGGETKKSSKKRKKDVESEDDEEKPAKTPKTTKLKLTSPKDPATTEKKPKEPKAPKPKAEKRKSKAPVSDDEMVDEPEKAPDPAEERKSREKEVLFLRHKLQKGFLSRDQAPQESEMEQMSNYIKKLENYGDLEVSIIRATKINKVLKALTKLNTIPKDEVFDFRGRSVEMLSKWNKILGSESADADDKKASTPTTNGVHKEETEPKSEAADTPAEKVSEPVETTSTVPIESAAPAEGMGPFVETTDELKKEASAEDAEKATEESKSDVQMSETEPEKVELASEDDAAPAPTPMAAEATEVTTATD